MAGPQSTPPELPGFTYSGWLGSGGFADVFRYTQDDLGREVAVKVLLADLPDEAATLFASEINLMAKLSSHPSIVSVFQAGVAADGRPFLVMEECPPPTLRGRLRREPYDVPTTLEIGIQIASAVETAHRLGVIHRDIKPSNILFTEYGRAALTDFGISIPTASVPGADTAYSVAWAPPEQILNQTVVPATDIYSLGATLWAMLVGHSPFEAADGHNSYEAIQERNLSAPVPPIGRADVPASLEHALVRALDKDPAKRQPSALDFARQLQDVQSELGLPRTTIDVRVDSSERAAAAAEPAHEGTRLASFEPNAAPPAKAPAPKPVASSGAQFWLPLSQGNRPNWWADDRTGTGWRPTTMPGRPMAGPAVPGRPVQGRPMYAPQQRPAGYAPLPPGYPAPRPAPVVPATPPAPLHLTEPKRAGMSTWTKAILIAVATFVIMLVILFTVM